MALLFVVGKYSDVQLWLQCVATRPRAPKNFPANTRRPDASPWFLSAYWRWAPIPPVAIPDAHIREARFPGSAPRPCESGGDARNCAETVCELLEPLASQAASSRRSGLSIKPS